MGFSCRINFVQGTLLFAILDFDFYTAPGSDAQRGIHGIDACQWWITADRSFMTMVCSDFTFRVTDIRESAEKMLTVAPTMLESYTNGNPVKRGSISFDNVLDHDEVQTKCAEHGLEPTLFVYDNLIVFWRLGNSEYRLDSSGPTSTPGKQGGFLSKIFRKK